MKDVSRNQARQDFLNKALKQVLELHVPELPAEGPPISVGGSRWRSFAARNGRPALLIDDKIDNFYRASSFRGYIGDAILRFTHDAGGDISKNRLMLAVYFDRYPPGAVVDLVEYSNAYLGGNLNWLLISAEGRGHLRLFGQDHEIHMSSPLSLPSLSVSGSTTYSLFSNQNQWLLKCLLMPGLSPDRYWQGPSMRPGSISELAEVAKVPQSSVSTFVQCAEKHGYLRRLDRGFVIIRHRELLDDWAAAIKARSRGPSLGVRPLYGDEPVEKLLDRIGSEQADRTNRISLAVSSHLACAILGISNSNQRGTIFYSRDDIEATMSALQLVSDESDTPWAVMIHPLHAKTIFNGAVYRPEYRAPLADLLQIYLDVRLSMARGAEQAEFIYQSILAKHFRAEVPC